MSATRLIRGLERRVFPERSRAKLQRYWEGFWTREESDEPWMHRPVSKQIVEAVESGWFPAGGSALDLGCGEGDVTHWLSEQGFPSLGVDFAGAAIERARARYGEVAGRREFLVLDIVREALPDRRYAVVVDRGCFHAVKRANATRYVRNVAQMCAPGARFLLFISAFRGETRIDHSHERELQDRRIDRAFSRDFEISRSEETDLAGPGEQAGDPQLPGLAYWMSRR
jgi:SAM-dependent methyltransferase